MRGWIDSQIPHLVRLVRQPGIPMVFAGFTVALAFFSLSEQIEQIPLNSGWLPIAFWSGEALMLAGLIRFGASLLGRFLPGDVLRFHNYRAH